jgi:Lysylphosphatidylglycerol synthase TM region
LLGVVVLLVCGALLASARLAFIASDLGYRMRAVDAIAALSLGQLGGAIFFQIVGQLVARSAVLARRGVPVAGTVAVTGYERVLALVVSMGLAIAGGWYLFGKITLDIEAGGATFLRLLGGGICAVVGSAALGWWKPVAVFMRENLRRRHAWQIARSAILSVLIQACTMAAYVVAAHALAPETQTVDIAAASAVVMLAASVPISLAGWGVRELGAIYVLGVIGIGRETALVIAILVGAAALAAVAILAAGVALARVAPSPAPTSAPPAPRFDLSVVLAWGIPVIVAIAMLFQVHAPLATSRLNVNLADPLVLVAASLFVLELIRARRLPDWRLPLFNAHLAAMTAVILFAFARGWLDFGITTWALTNRLAGWFVLLAYLATGALIVAYGGYGGLRMALRTFVGAVLAITAFDLVIYSLARLGIDLPKDLLFPRLEGFAQNPNAFSLQLILAFAAITVCVERARAQTLCFAMALIGMWFCGSRAGFIALALVLLAAFATRSINLRRLIWAAALAVIVIEIVDWLPEIVVAVAETSQLVINFVVGTVIDLYYQVAAWITGSAPSTSSGPLLTGGLTLSPPRFSALEVITSGYGSSNVQRIASLEGGWAMFNAHPLIGAGLGAFIESYMRANGVALVIHSTPLWLMAETGIVGLFIFAVAFLRILKHEIYQGVRGDPARTFLIMALLGFAAIATVHDILYQRTFWLLIGAALAYRPAADAK